jgi:hypothetical protein
MKSCVEFGMRVVPLVNCSRVFKLVVICVADAGIRQQIKFRVLQSEVQRQAIGEAKMILKWVVRTTRAASDFADRLKSSKFITASHCTPGVAGSGCCTHPLRER